MNITKLKLKPSKGIKCTLFPDYILCENTSDYNSTVEIDRLYTNLERKAFIACYDAVVTQGQTSVLRLTNRFHETLVSISPREKFLFEIDPPRLFYFSIEIPARSSVRVNKIDVEYDLDSLFQGLDDCFQDNLLIGPGYPSEGNKYY